MWLWSGMWFVLPGLAAKRSFFIGRSSTELLGEMLTKMFKCCLILAGVYLHQLQGNLQLWCIVINVLYPIKNRGDHVFSSDYISLIVLLLQGHFLDWKRDDIVLWCGSRMNVFFWWDKISHSCKSHTRGLRRLVFNQVNVLVTIVQPKIYNLKRIHVIATNLNRIQHINNDTSQLQITLSSM